MKDRSEQSLASAYILYLYKLHWSYISEENWVNLEGWDQEVARYIITNTGN